MEFHPDLIDYDDLRDRWIWKSAEYHKVFRWLRLTDSAKLIFFSYCYERYEFRDVTSERHALNPVYEYASAPNSRLNAEEYMFEMLRKEI